MCTTRDTQVNLTFADSEEKSFSVSGLPAADTYRLNITANNGDTYLAVSQFQVYANAPPSSPPGALPVKLLVQTPPSYNLLSGTVPTIPTNDISAPGYDAIVGDQIHMQNAASVAGGRHVILGDSIANCLEPSAISVHAVRWGIGGGTTSALLNALPMYTALHNANAVILIVGHNDIYYNVLTDAQIEARLQMMFDWFVGPLVWVPIPHVVALPGWSQTTAQFNTRVDAINAWAASYISSRPKTAIADLTGFDPATMTSDGTHTDVPAGSTFMQNAIAKAIPLAQ